MNFLPGWFLPGAAGIVKVTILTQTASATVEDQSTITGPASIQAGDLLILYDIARNTSVPTAVVPTGFTIINNSAGVTSNQRLISSYKIADGSEASASLSGMNGASISKMLYVFRGDVPIRVVSVLDITQETNALNPTAQVVNASNGAVPLIVFGCYSVHNGLIDARSFSTTKDGELQARSSNITTDNWIAYKIYNSTPADTTIDMADEGAENYLSSFYIECS